MFVKALSYNNNEIRTNVFDIILNGIVHLSRQNQLIYILIHCKIMKKLNIIS